MSDHPEISEQPAASTGVPTHSATLYFEDGDVVLSAKDKAGAATLFRVDQRFLTRHSPIFADMFALPSGTEKREEYAGVPIVHLPQDDAEDVTSMLQAIYNG